MSEMAAPQSITCPICQRTSYNYHDVVKKYCGACHRFTSEVGRELKASELEPDTVVIVSKEGRNTSITAWVKDVQKVGVVFYAGELRLYSLFFRMGEELHDDNGRLHVFQYLGGDAPTSGMAKA